MKNCTACGESFDGVAWTCPRCRHEPPRENGVCLFAPALARQNEGFKPEYFEELAGVEDGHFWFRNRNRLLVWALQTYFPSARSFLEIGCGTGFVLSGVKKAIPHLALAGSELFLNGLAYARSRLPDAALYQMDARQIPFTNEFDVIGAFDVLEHIDEDEDVLRQMHQAIAPGGGLLITVPQHRWLWSAADIRACHKRRYAREELVRKVKAAGFAICRVSSFVTLLLPLLWLSRRRQNLGGKDAGRSEYPANGAVHRGLENLLGIEAAFIRRGLSWPAGGSLLLAARKE